MVNRLLNERRHSRNSFCMMNFMVVILLCCVWVACRGKTQKAWIPVLVVSLISSVISAQTLASLELVSLVKTGQ